MKTILTLGIFYLVSSTILSAQCSMTINYTPDGLGNNGIYLDGPTTVNSFPVSFYIWDFGDGSATSATSNNSIHHNYFTPGNYMVKLKVQADNICEDSVLITVSDPAIGCVAGYTALPNPSQWGTYNLSGFASGGTAPYSYVWNFGATAQNETYQLTSVPEEICLIIVDMNGCSDTYCDTLYPGSPLMVPTYWSTVPTNGCNGILAVSSSLLENDCAGYLVADPEGSVDFGSMWMNEDTLFFNTCDTVVSIGIADESGVLCNSTYVDPATAFTVELNQNDIKIYPNPSSSEFHVEIDLTHDYESYIIYNAEGKEIYKNEIISNSFTINMPLEQGVYFIEFIGAEFRTTKILIRE